MLQLAFTLLTKKLPLLGQFLSWEIAPIALACLLSSVCSLFQWIRAYTQVPLLKFKCPMWPSGLSHPLWVNCYHLLQTSDSLPSLHHHRSFLSSPMFSALPRFTLPFHQSPASHFSSKEPHHGLSCFNCNVLMYSSIYPPDSTYAPVSEFMFFYARTPKHRLGVLLKKKRGE